MGLWIGGEVGGTGNYPEYMTAVVYKDGGTGSTMCIPDSIREAREVGDDGVIYTINHFLVEDDEPELPDEGF